MSCSGPASLILTTPEAADAAAALAGAAAAAELGEDSADAAGGGSAPPLPALDTDPIPNPRRTTNDKSLFIFTFSFHGSC
jgi:hypothetical protein